MKRNYQIQASKRAKSQNRGQFLLVFMAFATGYLSSSILNVNQLGGFLNQSIGQIKLPGFESNAKMNPKKTNLVEHTPKLEFYTVLTKADKHVIPAITRPAELEKPQEPEKIAELVAEKKPKTPAEVVNAKPVTSLAAQKPAPAETISAAKDRFFVQLASFRYYSQAEKLKAKLILKGFDVKISAIRQGTMQWYRVMLGPYANISEAQKAKVIFQAKEHAPGIIRQMDA